MSCRTQLPRWPLRMHLWRLPLWLFGWINPDSHREYKRLLQENRRLRKRFVSVTVANEGCNQVGNERAIGILLLGRVNTGYDTRSRPFH